MGDFPDKSFDAWVTRSPPETYDCPRCHTVVHIDDEICSGCGAFLFELS
jgi:hypothetical protein